MRVKKFAHVGLVTEFISSKITKHLHNYNDGILCQNRCQSSIKKNTSFGAQILGTTLPMGGYMYLSNAKLKKYNKMHT